MRRVAFALVLMLAAALAPAGMAGAVPEKRPWATVNVCDTAGKRNSVGIRAGMPGTGERAQRMYIRFQLQWYRPSERHYVSLEPPSTWVDAGSARFRAAQRGFTFSDIADPAAGERFKMRGLVRFEWREPRRVEGTRRTREVVVKRARRITRGGLRGVDGGKPPGRSDAVCVIAGPQG